MKSPSLFSYLATRQHVHCTIYLFTDKDDNDNDTDSIELFPPVVIVECKSGGKRHRLSIDITLANGISSHSCTLCLCCFVRLMPLCNT